MEYIQHVGLELAGKEIDCSQDEALALTRSIRQKGKHVGIDLAHQEIVDTEQLAEPLHWLTTSTARAKQHQIVQLRGTQKAAESALDRCECFRPPISCLANTGLHCLLRLLLEAARVHIHLEYKAANGKIRSVMRKE